MESLYRKYRPQTFSDVVGQQHVVGTLERAVAEGRTSHAYLFCGPRGTGKTTMARLLAKALMCEQGPGHLPDGTCEQCMLIAVGEHPDVYELDAASRTGVDNVREEIINRVGYAPVQGRYKVYIIDEVHMLTTQAFNALLKTLEEPPSHVVFVLCTTDPQKIPATILSRVQRFDFRPIGNEDILARLAYVCEQENFTYEDAALELIVRNARGGMRDALSTLEQLSVFGGGVISLAATQDMLGAAPGAELEHVIDAMAARDVAELFAQVGTLVDAGRDLLQVTRELAARMRDVYVVSIAGANPAVLPTPSDARRLQAEADAFGSADRIARILSLLGDVSREMSTAPNQRLVLEIAFTKIARPQEDLTLESLAERVAMLEQQLAAFSAGERSVSLPEPQPVSQPTTQETPTPQWDATPGAEPSAPQASVPEPQSATQPEPVPAYEYAAPQAPAPQWGTAPTPQSAPQPEPASRWNVTPEAEPAPSAHAPQAEPARSVAPVPVSQTASAPQPQYTPVSEPQAAPALATEPSPAPAPEPASVPQAAPEPPANATVFSDPGALQRAWRQVVTELMTRLPARGSLLSSAMATSDDGSTLIVSLPKGSSFALKMLERPDIRQAVEQFVCEVFGQRTLEFKEGLDAGPSNRSRKEARPAPSFSAPAPVAPAVERPSRPAPRQAVPEQQPRQSYPMPWDEPAQPVPQSVAQPVAQPVEMPAPEPEPYYDAVPYEEFGSYVPDEQYDTPVQMPTPEPAPTPEPSPVPEPTSRPVPEPTPTSQPTSPEDFIPEAPSELPPELAAILENAFDVFGSDIKVSK